MENKNYHKLIIQIDAFIKKYYRNRMIKGLLLFLFFGGLAYLSIVLLEHFGRFNSSVRLVLFYGGVALAVFLLVRYLIIPLMKLFNFGETINHEQASRIIGGHFPGVDDKLLNTLQLRSEYSSGSQSELLMASIEQRSGELSVVPFTSAVKSDQNKRYLLVLLPVLLTFVLIFWLKPNIFTGSTERLVNYNEQFVPQAPFDFNVVNKDLIVAEGEELLLDVELTGNDFPEKVYINYSEGTFLLNKQSKSKFEFLLSGLKDDEKISFSGGGYESELFAVVVLKKPEVTGINMILTYPDYLNRKPKQVENAGDINIPEGTQISWDINTKKADNVSMIFKDTVLSKKNILVDRVSFVRKVDRSQAYDIFLSRNDNMVTDSTRYSIDVVTDKYPKIQVNQDVDSTSSLKRFFSGEVSDDYGLTSLYFYFNIDRKSGEKESKSQKVSINTRFNKSNFFHHFDLSELGLKKEDKLTYYFVVKDNDKPHGFKSVRSSQFSYEVPSGTELAKESNEANDKVKKDLQETIKKASDFQKKIENLKKNSLQKENFNWKDVQQMNELIKDQQSLENDLLELNQDIQKAQEQQEQFNEVSEDLLEKQELINDLLENIMDDELKDLLDQLKEMMENQDKKEFDENINKLEQDSDDMKDKLDNSLELLKRLEIEEKNEQISNNLKDLAKEQEELSKKVKNKAISNEKAQEEQKDIEDKFKQVKEDVERLMEKNNDLKDPMKLDDQKELQKEVDQEMENSSESLDKNKSKKASESQKKSSDKMEEMANNMQAQMQQQQQEQAGEDMQALRVLLENIVTLSVDQEGLMKSFNGLSKRNPKYVAKGPVQQRINRDTKLVEDSLRALATRVPQIASFVDKEMRVINDSEKEALGYFEERKTAQMNVEQQRVMTGFNNLALLLNESLEQMQKQAQSQMAGSGSCNKPGGKGSKPSSGMSMQQMKDMLKKQLEQMKKGNNPGGKKPGDKPGEGQGGFGMGDKAISKMAREQSKLRKELKRLSQKLNKNGSGRGNGLNEIAKDLEKMEKDLVNKRFSRDLIRRQKDILTRMLESEKAIREQEFDNKRKSKSGENKNNSNLILLEQYKKKKLKEIELLKSVPPGLNEYYKNKANEYINVLN